MYAISDLKCIKGCFFVAVNGNSKLKLLYLLNIFRELTDEEHPATMTELIAELGRYGIKSCTTRNGDCLLCRVSRASGTGRFTPADGFVSGICSDGWQNDATIGSIFWYSAGC